jgi:hypothetical protein
MTKTETKKALANVLDDSDKKEFGVTDGKNRMSPESDLLGMNQKHEQAQEEQDPQTKVMGANI